jgi:hypothetical protein
MGSVGTDDKFVMMDRVEDQLWGLWIRVQWGMAYGMGQWMARCCGSGSSGAWPMGWVSGWQGARWLSARAHVGVDGKVLWIRVQWGMAYGMGQWMARCQVVECESSCWSLQCSAVFLLVFVSI